MRVGSGKVEIGQGILTALTQIAAEELDVGFEQVRLVSGQTDISPAEGFTSGSYSVAVGGASIRLVCAEVRSLFLDRVAEQFGCKVSELSIEDGQFLRAGKPTGHDYWSLAGDIALDRRASGTAPVKRPSTYRIVGRSVPRLDLPAKVAGAAFIHDIAPDNVLHARVLRQPWRGAQLVALDESAVRKAARRPIDILREGDFVAFTADERDRGDARRRGCPHAGALGRRHARARCHRRAGLAEGAAVARPHGGDRPRRPRQRRPRGRGAPTRRPFLPTARSVQPARSPSSRMARSRCGRTRQGPAVLRDWLARALGLAAAQVTVFHRQGAGAYGHNTADDAAFDASFIAMRMPGKTVRVQWSREDEFTGAPISTAMAIGLRADARCRQQAGRLDDRDLERVRTPSVPA